MYIYNKFLKNLDNKNRIEFFKLFTSDQRKALIIKKMKEKGIKVGSGVPNKTYYKENIEVIELIKIANCFPELRN